MLLARVMNTDPLEDCRIAAIEGIAALKAKDPRIYHVLIEGMEHEDPAIRLQSLPVAQADHREGSGQSARSPGGASWSPRWRSPRQAAVRRPPNVRRPPSAGAERTGSAPPPSLPVRKNRAEVPWPARHGRLR